MIPEPRTLLFLFLSAVLILASMAGLKTLVADYQEDNPQIAFTNEETCIVTHMRATSDLEGVRDPHVLQRFADANPDRVLGTQMTTNCGDR